MIEAGWTGAGNTTRNEALKSARKATKAGALRAVSSVGLGVAVALALAGQVTDARAQDIKGDVEAAKDKISMCTGCHAIPGYKSSFPGVYHVPLIAGQSEQFLTNALIAYRKGDRDHPTMRSIAGSLSDQDIADLAAFYAQAN